MDQTTPDRINEVVSTLVESLSQMVDEVRRREEKVFAVVLTIQVMSSIQGDIQEGLREHTSQLINSTNQLITIAKMAAADDPSLLTPVTDSIKETSTGIGKFIDAFKQFARNREDQKMNILFSGTSKDLAGTGITFSSDRPDKILLLINIIDPTSAPRMAIMMRKAVLDLSEVERLCAVDWPLKDKIISACEEFEISSKLVILTATLALNASKNEERRLFFDSALDNLEESTVIILDNARKFSQNPHDPNNSAFQSRVSEHGKLYAKGIGELVKAVKKEEESPFNNFFSAIRYIQILVVVAKKLAKAALIYQDAVMKGEQQFDVVKVSKAVVNLLQDTIQTSREVMDQETDPSKRAFLEQCIWDLEDVVPEFDDAVEEFMSKSPNSKQATNIVYTNIQKVTKRIITGVDEETYALDATTPFSLNSLSLTNLDSLIPGQETAFTNSLGYSPAVETETTEKVVSKIIDDTFDPDTKNRLVKEKETIIGIGNKLIAASRALHMTPSASVKKEFEETRDLLAKCLGENNLALFEATHSGFVELQSGKKRILRDPLPEEFAPAKGDKALLAASKEQVVACFNLLREVAYLTDNSELQEKLDEIFPRMMTLLGELIDVATRTSNKTEDLTCLGELRNKQYDLNMLAMEIAVASAPDIDPDTYAKLKDSTKGSEGTKGISAVMCFTEGCEKVKALLLTVIAEDGKSTQFDNVSTEFAEKFVNEVKNVARALKDVAAVSISPELRGVRKGCLDAANSCLDNSMRMKILVKGVLNSEEDPANKVANAALAAIDVFKESTEYVDTFITKDNVKQTHAQTLLLHKIITEVRSHRSVKV